MIKTGETKKMSIHDIAGIDYGNGLTNIDLETGIRYGITSTHSLYDGIWDDLESVYPDPCCPSCGNELTESVKKDHRCIPCKKSYWSDELGDTDPICFTYGSNGYQLETTNDCTNLFICESPYYTTCLFCSPCVPGAGDLDNPIEGGVKTYCLGHDWYQNDIAPYPVYSVVTGELVAAQNKD